MGRFDFVCSSPLCSSYRYIRRESSSFYVVYLRYDIWIYDDIRGYDFQLGFV